MWLDDLRGESRMEFFLDSVRACAMVSVPTMILHLSAGNNPPPIASSACAVTHASARKQSVSVWQSPIAGCDKKRYAQSVPLMFK